MDDMYQYASAAVNSNSTNSSNMGQGGTHAAETNDIVLQAFTNFGWGNRFSSLLDTVKKQSGAIIDVTRRDLEEIATLLREDGSPTPTRGMSPSTSSTTTDPSAASGSHSTRGRDNNNDSDARTAFSALRDRIGALDLNGILPTQRLPENMDLSQLKNEVVQGTRYAEQYLSKFGSEVFDILSNAITIREPEEHTQQQQQQQQQQQRVFATRKENLLAKMRTDPNTFLQEPKESKILNTFVASFNIDDYTDEIAKLLDDMPDLREVMNELVPVKVSYPIFWQRYFYHAWCIDQEEKKRQMIVQEAEDDDDADFKWDSDEEDQMIKELSSNSNDEAKRSLESKLIDGSSGAGVGGGGSGGGVGGGSDTDFSNISEPASTEASLVSPPLRSQADGDDWIKADAKRKSEEEDSDSDWE
ncbi:hypothetical protein BX666DRAFT_2028268 [Dichotomocladium elegans]|nr:hypothetical protein BX666DRAFT_2028268 [Dichotomocladium elegans]